MVEILVAVAVLLASFVSVLTAFQVAARHGRGTLEQVQGAALAEEGIEAMTSLRDTGWSNLASLSAGTSYALYFDGTQWKTTATPQIIDGVFQRTVVVNDVYRRTSDKDIVASTSLDTKAIDAGTKKITVRVSWATTTQQAGKRIMEAYLMNLFE
ncbi:MAG: hypothetical protein G01um101417_595 [Parcubacteria group bacterium Gr01-1014_17]|nr:MAG: hypothetical protein G01um101417_595 [Parcubacteria group bacterium Gr01-1014_17]